MRTTRHNRIWSAGVAAAASVLLAGSAGAQERVASPDGRNAVTVEIRDGGVFYTLERDGRRIIMPSRLGFEFRGAQPLRAGLSIVDRTRSTVDETWTQPWGEVAQVHDHHNELRISLAEGPPNGRQFAVVFRVFNDGIGFRYELPEESGLGDFEITDELTEFSLADDAKAWWIPSNLSRKDRSEMLYSSSPVSRLDSVQTPLTMTTTGGTYVVIHEAHLADYARMNLAGVRPMEDRTLRVALAPLADGTKVRGRTPFATPWRTIQLADRAQDLAPSVLGLNLNPPSEIEDTDWIRPMKYVGIWWGMHIGTMSWGSGPTHGATTENAKRYIDFAAANGFGGVLVEGWNTGWDGDWINNAELFSFTEAHPDYDLEEVASYAREKGVTLIMHNETSGGIANYERQMEEAYALYRSLGSNAIKSGYVADGSQGHAHWSQFMVRHHRKAIETAAHYGIMLDVHEPVHDTGERRTWPNMMTREGARGQEYNAWGAEGGNPPEHETILFFTRLLAGPMDFTPGIFDILIERPTGQPRRPDEARVRTTLAKQLALYVVLYSPLHMAADLPENYENQPAFQFIRDVAVDWEQTRVLEGRIGDYVVVARQERDSDNWYLGAITDEEGRTFEIPLSFLPRGRKYVAEIYADAPAAHWLTNPLPVTISERAVDATTRLSVVLAPGGGQAIRIRPAS
jgi:alpha-glucosidase